MLLRVWEVYMVPEWPMRIGTSSTVYPDFLRSSMRVECCVLHFSSWSSIWLCIFAVFELNDVDGVLATILTFV